MNHPDKPIVISPILFILTALIFVTCNNDDDNTGPQAIVFPHEMAFYNIQEQSLELWVGGQAVSTAGMTPQQLIPSGDYEPLAASWYEESVFIFTSDSVTSANDPESYRYFFSNDTLYFELDFGSLVNFPIGTGSLFELRIAQGYLRYCQFTGSFETCGSQGRNVHFTIEEALSETAFATLDEMGASDTLLIYNQVVVFKP